MTTENLTITINPHIKKELEFLFKSLKEDENSHFEFESTEHLINYILSCVADGSRRPGAWERTMLQMMGLVPDNEIFNNYRKEYGEPNGGGNL